jgi:hypothetical protein
MDVMGTLVVGFGIFILVYGSGLATGFFRADKNPPQLVPFFTVMGPAFMAVGAYGIHYIRRTVLTLYPDRLEYRGGLRTVILSRRQIAGRTADRVREYATSFKVRPLQRGTLDVAIDLYANQDDAFRAWFADVPIVKASAPAI